MEVNCESEMIEEKPDWCDLREGIILETSSFY